MIELPNPFTNSALPTHADEAGVSPADQVDAPANQSLTSTGGFQEAPVADVLSGHDAAGAFDCIGEIFVGAMKLDHRFVLDEILFMEALEEPPLFLRATA